MRVGLVHFNHTIRDGLVGWADMNTSKWKPNYGDMLVCAAILRQIDATESVQIGFGGTATGKLDYAVVRGSTYLHNEFDFDAAIKTLESIDAPIACVGLGAQNPEFDATYLDQNEKARRFVSILAERSSSISARGAFSAEVLARLGARNVRVTGCPSLFYKKQAVPVSVSPLLAKKKRIGVSIHSGLTKNIFCRDPERALLFHGNIIDYCRQHDARYCIFEQGNVVEHKIADHRLALDERREAAQTFLKRVKLEGKIDIDEVISRFVSVLTIEEWLGKVRDLDAMVGFRFHGNMVGLLQGIPCYYYVYDSRLEEFCQLYNLPYLRVEKDWNDPVREIENFDWQKTNAAIDNCRKELLAFYEENKIVLSDSTVLRK
jgi:Polysaccharide pyruvyl transferase